MTDIPPEIRAEIERDVKRYRKVRLAAARKRLTPKYLAKLARQAEYQTSRDQIVEWYASGESIDAIANRFKFISREWIKSKIHSWLFDHLNSNFLSQDFSIYNDNYDGDLHNLINVPRYSEPIWRETIVKLQQVTASASATARCA